MVGKGGSVNKTELSGRGRSANLIEMIYKRLWGYWFGKEVEDINRQLSVAGLFRLDSVLNDALSFTERIITNSFSLT